MEMTFPALFRDGVPLGGTNRTVELFELPANPQAPRIWGVRLHRLIVVGGCVLPKVGDAGFVLQQMGEKCQVGNVLAEDMVIVGSSGFVEEQPGVFAFETVDLETGTCPALLKGVSKSLISP